MRYFDAAVGQWLTRIRDVTLPLRLVTLENQREHWAKKAKRAKEQRSLAKWSIGWHAFDFVGGDTSTAYIVRLTRVAPRKLDPGNFQGCFKHVQDGVADWLGIDDGDPRIEWVYQQEQKPKTYACRIVIERKE